MKNALNRFIDWFESKFSILIDTLALLGGAFCIFLAIFVFITLLIGSQDILEVLDVVAMPGAIGFFGIIVLFALRITRSIAKK
ncbi:MAG: hypothetical protein WC509_08355 [Candidatus Izemoplasmatales bacterium]